MYPSTHHTDVRQILHDGQPAVIVTHRIQHYRQRDLDDALGKRKAGEPTESEIVARQYLKFPSPRPIEIAGRPAVGQWADKKFNHLRGTIVDNPDPSTHIDFEAWIDAFDQVYGES